MNSRGFNRRRFTSRYQWSKNPPEARRLPMKRKFEGEEPLTASKRPLYSSYTREESAAVREPLPPHSSRQLQVGFSYDEPSNLKEQPNRYSANDRLKQIRQNNQDRHEAQPAPVQVQRKQHKPSTEVDNIQIQFSPKSNEKQSFVVTAKPSSLQERLAKPSSLQDRLANIRRSKNEFYQTNSVKSSTATSRDHENIKKSLIFQDKLVDYYKPDQERSYKVAAASSRNATNLDICTGTAHSVSTATRYSNVKSAYSAVQDKLVDYDARDQEKLRKVSADSSHSTNVDVPTGTGHSVSTATRYSNVISGYSTFQDELVDYDVRHQERPHKISPAFSITPATYSNVKSAYPTSQDKLVDYDMRAQERLHKVSAASSHVPTNLNVCAGTPTSLPTATTYSNLKSGSSSVSHGVRSNSSLTGDDNFMDWSYIEEREVLIDLQDLRKGGVVSLEVEPQTPFQEVIAKVSAEIPQNKTILKDIYVVVDTNIFISHLNIVKELLDIKINGVVSPIVLIPWMVIQELDYIKDGRSENKLKNKAQNAINFINDNLLGKNSQIKGQSVRDATRQDFSSKSADDGILFCCLQIVERCNRPMLLSNDVNLRNKAIINGIDSYGHNEIVQALDPFRNVGRCSDVEQQNTTKELEAPLSQLLSNIIPVSLEEAFGVAAWSKMRCSLKSLPWSLQYCLIVLQKYWTTVFTFDLQKQCLSKIEKLHELLSKQSTGKTNSMDIEHFIELCLELCVFLKNGFTNYSEKIIECINCFQSAADTFTKS